MTKPWTWHRYGGWSAGKKLSFRDINRSGLGSLLVMSDGEELIEGAACAVNLAHQVTGHVPVGMGPEGIGVDEAGAACVSGLLAGQRDCRSAAGRPCGAVAAGDARPGP